MLHYLKWDEKELHIENCHYSDLLTVSQFDFHELIKPVLFLCGFILDSMQWPFIRLFFHVTTGSPLLGNTYITVFVISDQMYLKPA